MEFDEIDPETGLAFEEIFSFAKAREGRAGTSRRTRAWLTPQRRRMAHPAVLQEFEADRFVRDVDDARRCGASGYSGK